MQKKSSCSVICGSAIASYPAENRPIIANGKFSQFSALEDVLIDQEKVASTATHLLASHRYL
jgi:hypothetical protein